MPYKSTYSKVALRQKPGAKGRISLYLDYYPPIVHPNTLKSTRREFLGLYIFAKADHPVKEEFNARMLEKAEAIRCARQLSIINKEFDFVDDTKQRENAVEYFKEFSNQKGGKYIYACTHFENFAGKGCTFADLSIDFCNGFREYLLSARQLKNKDKPLTINAASAYWLHFRSMLKKAHLDKYLKENLNNYLEQIDTEDVHKEFLTADELRQLAATPCKIDVLKRASLFSCLTGLRVSDVLNLSWENVVRATDGGYCVRIRTIKTGTEATLPISDEALELCGVPGKGIVFKGFKRPMIYAPLKQWIKEAGIDKNLTFHCFRHTYATLQIAAGTDIYTVSKMLTHRNVATTQIYAELVSEKKRETVGRISLR